MHAGSKGCNFLLLEITNKKKVKRSEVVKGFWVSMIRIEFQISLKWFFVLSFTPFLCTMNRTGGVCSYWECFFPLGSTNLRLVGKNIAWFWSNLLIFLFFTSNWEARDWDFLIFDPNWHKYLVKLWLHVKKAKGD